MLFHSKTFLLVDNTFYFKSKDLNLLVEKIFQLASCPTSLHLNKWTKLHLSNGQTLLNKAKQKASF